MSRLSSAPGQASSLSQTPSPSVSFGLSVGQASQKSGIRSPSASTLSSPPGQISALSQTPSASESSGLSAGQGSQPSATPSPSVSMLSSEPGQASPASQTPSPSPSMGSGVKTQPIPGSQLSMVQTSPSTQVSGAPALQVPAPSQMSETVHALPSSQLLPDVSY